MSSLSRLATWWVHCWESTQVELHGQYSLTHLQDFERYQARTSWLRVAFVCLLTPLPVISYVLLIDAIPLEPPERGSLHSPRLWGRTWLMSFQNGCCILEQMHQHIPQLAASRRTSIAIAIAAATSAVVTAIVVSLHIGFPVPFTMIIGTIPWAIVTFGLSFFLRREQFREHPGLKMSVFLYLAVTMGQLSLLFIYPIYNYFYKSLSSWNQTAFVLLLPVIKIAMKNWICRALPDSDDVKPEAVVFNVEIFHALFVSLCMGNTSSSKTVVALMAVDLMQAWLSFHDMMNIVKSLDPVFTNVTTTNSCSPPHRPGKSIVTVSHQNFPASSISQPHQPEHTGWYRSIHKLLKLTRRACPRKQVAPVQVTSFVSIPSPPGQPRTPSSTQMDPRALGSLRVEGQTQLLQQTQRLLFATEFVVLIEYIEVLMPAMYSIFLVGLFSLPNRAFYPFLQGIDSYTDLTPMMGNLLLYGSCEFASLILMAVIVWWKLRLSLAHQLAFVLERRAVNIQAKLILWVVWIMQNTIVQLGADYSLRFAWLRSSTNMSLS